MVAAAIEMQNAPVRDRWTLWTCPALPLPPGPLLAPADTYAVPIPKPHALHSSCLLSPSTNLPSASPAHPPCSELVLHSVNIGVLGALFTWGAVPRPGGLGIQDYGGGLRALGLCPPSPNCISTAEEANDPEHYVPQW